MTIALLSGCQDADQGGLELDLAGIDASQPDGSTGKVFDAGSEPDRNEVVAGALCERLATILCAGEAFCCDAPLRERDACELDWIDFCRNTYVIDDVSADPIVGFDARAVSDGFTELERRASNCDPTIAQWFSQESFADLLAGTVEPGGDCSPSGARLAADLAALVSCKDPVNNACMVVDEAGTTWRCVPRSPAGGECFSLLNCQDGLFCRGDVCAPRLRAGEACSNPEECQSFVCQRGKCVEATQQNAYCPE